MTASKKVALTDRFLKTLKPAPSGKREMIWDALQPHLGVRVTDKGKLSFVVVKRQAGDTRPTRHYVGSYPALSLADARTAARDALSALMKGDDPKELERERIRKERQADTFGLVAQEFISRHVAKLRSGRSTELIINRELLGLTLKRRRVDGKWKDEWTASKDPRWRDRPIAKISRRDVIEFLENIADNGSRYQARKVFATLSKLFNWALLRDAYDLQSSPVSKIRCADVLGNFPPRSRVLADDELRAIWVAAQELGYPFGTLVQMLMLTGQRLRELSNASWCEILQHQDLLVVPANRMKAKVAHSVPLTPNAREILAQVPRFKTSNSGSMFIFSTTFGKRPFSGFGKMKFCLDEIIKRTVDEDGEHRLSNMPHWTLHDIRRTVRTRLSALGVLPLVAELVIGHKQTGIQAVYDLHTYDREKRAALELWSNRLAEIVGLSPPPNNVIALRTSYGGTIDQDSKLSPGTADLRKDGTSGVC